MSLFPDLPEQAAPLYRYADEHVLEPCHRCGATGKEANRWAGLPWAWEWDPNCRGCIGAGKRLVHVGKVRDL